MDIHIHSGFIENKVSRNKAKKGPLQQKLQISEERARESRKKMESLSILMG